MLFKIKVQESPEKNLYEELENKIRRDLISTLRTKGIDISNIHIDPGASNVNVSLKIGRRK